MALEERTLEPAIPERCSVCGARLTGAEQQAVLESGGTPLCSIHALDVVPVEDEEEAAGP